MIGSLFLAGEEAFVFLIVQRSQKQCGKINAYVMAGHMGTRWVNSSNVRFLIIVARLVVNVGSYIHK